MPLNLSKVIDLFSIEELASMDNSMVQIIEAFTGKKLCLAVS